MSFITFHLRNYQKPNKKIKILLDNFYVLIAIHDTPDGEDEYISPTWVTGRIRIYE